MATTGNETRTEETEKTINRTKRIRKNIVLAIVVRKQREKMLQQIHNTLQNSTWSDKKRDAQLEWKRPKNTQHTATKNCNEENQEERQKMWKNLSRRNWNMHVCHPQRVKSERAAKLWDI